MDLSEYLQPVKKHARMIVALCLSTTIAMALFTYLQRVRYEATALVLVRPHEIIHLSSNRDEKELLNFPVAAGGKIEITSNSYIEVIKSRVVAEKVVRQMGLESQMVEKPPVTSYHRIVALLRPTIVAITQVVRYGRLLGSPSPFEGAVQSVQDNLELSPIKDTYLFQIKYSADDPKSAADVANAAADLFLQYMGEINTPETKRTLAFIEERLHESERELAASRQAVREFKERHGTVSFKEETSEQVKGISDLESTLDKTEVKLAALLKDLTPEHPKVQGLQAERERLLVALAVRRTRMSTLPGKERQLANLILNVQVVEEIYQIIRKEYAEAELRAGKEVSEIKVISPAVPPLYPSTKRSRMLYILLAIGMAASVGVTLAFGLEYLNTTIRKVEDVERVLQLPVLATLPSITIGR